MPVRFYVTASFAITLKINQKARKAKPQSEVDERGG